VKQPDTADQTEPVTGMADAPPTEERPRDVHCRLQELVDEHFGYRPTTPIEGLLTVLETELGGALGPALESSANGEAGDYTVTCSGCGEEMDEPHKWRECHEIVKGHVAGLDGAWWGVLGILHDVAPNAHSPEDAATSAAERLSEMETVLRDLGTLPHTDRCDDLACRRGTSCLCGADALNAKIKAALLGERGGK